MIMNKKFVLFILLFVSCSIGMIAQANFYYYRGMKIPLAEDNNKICVSILKNKGEVDKELLNNDNVIKKIKDADFDIFVIQQSELKKLFASKTWNKGAKSFLLSSCYRTKEGVEVFLTPFLNVRLKKEQDIDVLKSFAERYALRIVRNDSLMPLWYVLSISSETNKNALEVANVLWESGSFAASVPDFRAGKLACSNDPMFNQQWGLNNSSYPSIDISASSAWNYSTGKNVKIAFLDTGVDTDHLDLASNISNLSYDTESESSPSVCYWEHATHCAGIAAATKDNGIQIAGVAPEAEIVSISNLLNDSTSQIKLARGIVWAYQHGVDIINNSWYHPIPHPAIDEAINDAFRYGRQGKGCVIVFASGNFHNNYVCYPAYCNDTILAVGAINSMGSRPYFSNYGSKLDIVAPGVDILSTLPNNSVGYMDGTSMACAFVSGVAALVLERNPELTVTQVNSIICSNAKKISGVNFDLIKPDGSWNEEYGYGLVDAYNSVINTPHVVYIQNDTITGTKVISADSIYVGRNVTNTKEYGDVILGQGNITLKANYTEIKNSTTVPLGTTLKIEN